MVFGFCLRKAKNLATPRFRMTQGGKKGLSYPSASKLGKSALAVSYPLLLYTATGSVTKFLVDCAAHGLRECKVASKQETVADFDRLVKPGLAADGGERGGDQVGVG